MKQFSANYEAFGEQGAFMRLARTVGELPHADCSAALAQAAKNLGVSKISFGVPIWRTLGMTKRQVLADERDWLRFAGADLPLKYVNAGG
jgi:hypothetical protein